MNKSKFFIKRKRQQGESAFQMKKASSILLMFIVLCLMAWNSFAIQRFPKPEFETKYTQPVTQTPGPRGVIMEYLDVAILFASLAFITWLVLKKRSRKGVFWMSLFSLVYFGFYRKGCICSVGSIQNITLGLFNPEYHIPFTVIAFFILPLLFTVFYGRTFCAGVCPLGAIQDIFAIRPMKLNSWVQSLLGLIPFIYLGLGILYAATATDFIICRYDPFVGIFRFNATFLMFAIGGILLLTSVFIARPYCRFLCPYGVLLNLVSRVSKNHLTITPSKCIDCRLCENSCPFGAIQTPTNLKNTEKRNDAVKRFILYCVIIPFLTIGGGWTGAKFHENLANVNAKVRLANELRMSGNKENPSVEITTFQSSGKALDKFYADAASIVREFYFGGWILGGFIGLVFGLTLAGLAIMPYRTGYWPDKGTCLSCARCLEYCPVKKETIVH